MSLLHVYGQYEWHNTVWIVGDPDALTALRDAINDALVNREGSAETMTSDGEGYHAIVLKRGREDIDTLCLPYTSPICIPSGVHPQKLIPVQQHRALLGITPPSPTQEKR